MGTREPSFRLRDLTAGQLLSDGSVVSHRTEDAAWTKTPWLCHAHLGQDEASSGQNVAARLYADCGADRGERTAA